MTLRHRAVLGAAAAIVAGCGGGDLGASSTTTPASRTAAPGTAATDAVTYRDGTYEAEGGYGGMPSHIGVTVTLDGGVVAEVEVDTRATDPTSLDLQERFADAIPDVVVGRAIADLEVGKTAGSSGTPVGFNDALEQIRDQARTS